MLQPIDADRIRLGFESATGQLWAALVSRHFSEVRGLINNNRRVAAYWHLLLGPRLLRAATLFASTGDPVLLAQIDATEVDRRADQFLHALETYGSPGLRHDVQCHGGSLLALGWNGIVGLVADVTDKAA
jgi:hypothetical protein